MNRDILQTAPEKLLGSLAGEMENTPQNPHWHGEGSVLEHTKLVVKAMTESLTFMKADTRMQQILYLAAVFHDIGKARATRLENGQWVSPGHARTGAEMARQILWREFGLCGTPEKQDIREAVCNLIRYHSLPPYAIENADGKLRLMRAAANGEMIPSFTVRQLCTLSEADALGRICDDKADMLDWIALCAELAKEAGCYDGPYPFPTAHTAYACLSGRQVSPAHPLYDDTWGEVILLSGLPGTGKDTWIKNNCPQLPMISLDEIRAELKIPPTKNQGKVIDAARERTKELLRKKQSFVWNATNILPMTRKQQVDLFAAYGASVRLVYLETGWDEQQRRNAGRKDAVPESAISGMLEKLTPPERFEAHRVEWQCV